MSSFVSQDYIVGTETVFYLLQKMTRMHMHLKLEKVGPRFSHFNAMPTKIVKQILWFTVLPDENFIITLEEHFV